jgi:hypothetical protein
MILKGQILSTNSLNFDSITEKAGVGILMI